MYSDVRHLPQDRCRYYRRQGPYSFLSRSHDTYHGQTSRTANNTKSPRPIGGRGPQLHVCSGLSWCHHHLSRYRDLSRFISHYVKRRNTVKETVALQRAQPAVGYCAHMAVHQPAQGRHWSGPTATLAASVSLSSLRRTRQPVPLIACIYYGKTITRWGWEVKFTSNSPGQCQFASRGCL